MKTYHDTSNKVLEVYKKVNFVRNDFKVGYSLSSFYINSTTGKIEFTGGYYELRELIASALMIYGAKANLNFLDASYVNDFSHLFHESIFKEITIKKDDYKEISHLLKENDNPCFNISDEFLSINEYNQEVIVRKSIFKQEKNGFISKQVYFYGQREKPLSWKKIKEVTGANIDASFDWEYDLEDDDYDKLCRYLANESEYYHINLFLTEFNGVFDEWNAKSVITTNKMFYGSKYNNQQIKFDLSRLEDASYMFMKSRYNYPFIVKTPKLRNISGMFLQSEIRKEIKLDLDNVILYDNAFNSNQIKISQLKNIDFSFLKKVKGNEDYVNSIKHLLGDSLKDFLSGDDENDNLKNVLNLMRWDDLKGLFHFITGDNFYFKNEEYLKILYMTIKSPVFNKEIRLKFMIDFLNKVFKYEDLFLSKVEGKLTTRELFDRNKVFLLNSKRLRNNIVNFIKEQFDLILEDKGLVETKKDFFVKLGIDSNKNNGFAIEKQVINI